MNETELYKIVEQVILEEFERGIQTGEIPPLTDETDLQAMFEFNTDLLFSLASDDPHLKYILKNSAPNEVKSRLWNFVAA